MGPWLPRSDDMTPLVCLLQIRVGRKPGAQVCEPQTASALLKECLRSGLDGLRGCLSAKAEVEQVPPTKSAGVWSTPSREIPEAEVEGKKN